MQTRSLSGPAIAAIRRLIMAKCSRGEIKQFLLEAGAKRQRVLRIPVREDMKAPDYKSKNDIIDLGFDTIYQDFDKADADGIALRLVRIVLQEKQLERTGAAVHALDEQLVACGFSLAEVIASESTTPMLEVAKEAASDSELREAAELLAKALRRMHTDPPGTMTASVSAAESVCREALTRLGIQLPAKKQLPDYLVRLRRDTNIEALVRRETAHGERILSSLSTLGENLYTAAHEVSDRHARGDTAGMPSPLILDLMCTSSAALAIVIAGALKRNDLKLSSATRASEP